MRKFYIIKKVLKIDSRQEAQSVLSIEDSNTLNFIEQFVYGGLIVKSENMFTLHTLVGAGLPSPYEPPYVQIIMGSTIKGVDIPEIEGENNVRQPSREP